MLDSLVAPAVARRLVLFPLRRLDQGRLVIQEGDQEWAFGPPDGGLKATVTVHRPEVWSALLAGGSIGLGRTYMDGWWDADDLTSVIRMIIGLLPDDRGRLRRAGGYAAPLRSAAGRAAHALGAGPGGRDRDRANVRAHYDLSNEMFSQMLDPTMSYSCAWFGSPETSLEEAQVAKLDRICRKLRLEPGMRVLEIGTGWGALAVHAASHYGAEVTTTTISEQQHAYARDLVERRGLSEKVEVLDLDWRELTGSFDRLVSVEMIEAVDWPDHETFFRTCSRLLAPDGLMVLQAIVVADQAFERSRRTEDFVRRVIFPGGCLPSVTAVADALTRATDMRIYDLEDIGAHYPPTLAHWRSNFRANADRIEALGFDLAFRRMWEMYLSYCEAGFLERRISDVQMVMTKPRWRV